MIADRRKIFHEVHSSVIPGMIFVLIGIILYMIGRTQHDIFNQNDYLSIMVFSALVLWSGGFIAFYGINTAKKARFPMLFLLFMVPIPTFILDTFIAYLQTWSAHVSYGMLRLLGIPMIREGFVFHLPELSVEVAEQCSGIRSSIALFITSVLAGHIFLRSGWQKGILTMSIFPLAIIKNGIRIVTLTLLGAYVDGAFLTNSILHKKGGILFFILALLLLSPIIWLLRKTEKVEIDGKSVVTIKR